MLDLNPPFIDQFAEFENRVRTVGVWCDLSVKDKSTHKMICRNPNAHVAISLCGLIVKPIEKLHENNQTKHCLICDLYDNATKEVKELIDPQLDNVVNQSINQPTKKENKKTS